MNDPCIRLQMVNQQQDTAEVAVMVLEVALKFCAQPETFPVFMAFAQAESAGHEDIARILATLPPGVLSGLRSQLVLGLCSDAGFIQ